jgi:hypothetical protein
MSARGSRPKTLVAQIDRAGLAAVQFDHVEFHSSPSFFSASARVVAFDLGLGLLQRGFLGAACSASLRPLRRPFASAAACGGFFGGLRGLSAPISARRAGSRSRGTAF